MAQIPDLNPAGQSSDPFAARLSHGAKSWLWATGMQAACTCALLAAAQYAEGGPRETYARLIVLIGICATWCLALRTIRERLVELMRQWQKASHGLLKKASESGRHLIKVPLTEKQEHYIKGAIWRLRIIAAGLTIPFFVLPMLYSLLSMILFEFGPAGAKQQWATVATFTMFSACIVAGYFHWVIIPLPVPVRVSGLQRRGLPFRSRRG